MHRNKPRVGVGGEKVGWGEVGLGVRGGGGDSGGVQLSVNLQLQTLNRRNQPSKAAKKLKRQKSYVTQDTLREWGGGGGVGGCMHALFRENDSSGTLVNQGQERCSE